MRNIAVTLSYDGTNYHGWQRQKDLPTIQGMLEDALSVILKERIGVIGCGRTDAGVHAERYTANFRTGATIPTERIPFALNSQLPPDIAVSAAREVEWDFHSVFSCIRKEYTYRILNAPTRNPLLTNRVWWYPQPLNAERISLGTREFLGTHDFSAMRSTGTEVKTTVRTIFAFDIWKKSDIIEFVFRQTVFCTIWLERW
jgi:tRNA pseudouridine38-40 synthase